MGIGPGRTVWPLGGLMVRGEGVYSRSIRSAGQQRERERERERESGGKGYIEHEQW